MFQFVFNNLVLPPAFIRPSQTGGVPASAENAPLLGGEEDDAGVERRLGETAVLPSDLGQSGFDVVPVPPPQRSQ